MSVDTTMARNSGHSAKNETKISDLTDAAMRQPTTACAAM